MQPPNAEQASLDASVDSRSASAVAFAEPRLASLALSLGSSNDKNDTASLTLSLCRSTHQARCSFVGSILSHLPTIASQHKSTNEQLANGAGQLCKRLRHECDDDDGWLATQCSLVLSAIAAVQGHPAFPSTHLHPAIAPAVHATTRSLLLASSPATVPLARSLVPPDLPPPPTCTWDHHDASGIPPALATAPWGRRILHTCSLLSPALPSLTALADSQRDMARCAFVVKEQSATTSQRTATDDAAFAAGRTTSSADQVDVDSEQESSGRRSGVCAGCGEPLVTAVVRVPVERSKGQPGRPSTADFHRRCVQCATCGIRGAPGARVAANGGIICLPCRRKALRAGAGVSSSSTEDEAPSTKRAPAAQATATRAPAIIDLARVRELEAQREAQRTKGRKRTRPSPPPPPPAAAAAAAAVASGPPTAEPAKTAEPTNEEPPKKARLAQIAGEFSSLTEGSPSLSLADKRTLLSFLQGRDVRTADETAAARPKQVLVLRSTIHPPATPDAPSTEEQLVVELDYSSGKWRKMVRKRKVKRPS